MLPLFPTSHVKASEDAVETFKNYLATPPCISRIVYSEVSCKNTVSRTLAAGRCGSSFYVRELMGSENLNLPISITNRNQSPLYVGRLGDTRWQIAGYNTTISVDPNLSKPDSYTGMSDSMQTMVGGIFSLGSQHVQPGTFVWSGNKFKAKASPLAEQFGYKELDGEIVVAGGVVTSMIINGSGTWKYTYATSANLPVGLPSEIESIYGGGNDTCISKVIIREMIPAKLSDELNVFDPRSHIDNSVTILKVLSNSIVVIQPVENRLVTRMMKEQIGLGGIKLDQADSPPIAIRNIILLIMLLATIGFTIFVIRNKAN